MNHHDKLDLIESRLPLEVPLFSSFSENPHRLNRTVVFVGPVGFVRAGFWYLRINTECGLRFYISSPEEFIDTVFTQYNMYGDPNDFWIPFDIVYAIAQNPAKPIMWLLRKGSVSRFWQSPLCEPRLMGIIAGYAAQPPHCSSASIPPELDPRSLHS